MKKKLKNKKRTVSKIDFNVSTNKIKWWKKPWAIIVALATMIGIVKTFPDAYEWIMGKIKSEHQKFVEEKYIPGIVVPFNLKKETTINYGSGSFTFEIPTNGVNLADQTIFAGCTKNDTNGKIYNDEAFSYILKINSGIFLLSITIRDLKTGSVIAEIVDNKWVINKMDVNDWHGDSKSFEVLDQYKNVAFRMWVDENQQVQMRGYFYGKLCTLFVGDVIMQYIPHEDTNYVIEAEKYASELKPMFIKANSLAN